MALGGWDDKALECENWWGGRLDPVSSLVGSYLGWLAAWILAWGGRSADFRSWRRACPCSPSWWLRA